MGLATILALATSLASADDYRFEFGAGYLGERFESTEVFDGAPFPITNTVDADTDEFSVFGRWYFDGLSDDEGPRARAAFVDRASVANVFYSRAESTGSIRITSEDPTFLPFEGPLTEIDIDIFGIDGRFVSRDTGWFGQAGIAQTSISSDFVGADVDATSLAVGGGKYIAQNTALGVNLAQTDADEFDATSFGVFFTHLGTINPNWQYAFDFDYTRTDGDGDVESNAWRAALSFYPGQDLEFGLAIDGSDDEALLSTERVGYDFFGSWFITPNFQLAASYRIDDVDPDFVFEPTQSSTDQYAFRIGALIRF